MTISGGNVDLDQDFGYAPEGHNITQGLIGDTIFLDTGDGAGGLPNGEPDPGEGLEGVRVELYDSTGTTLLAVTYTDENGNYVFTDDPCKAFDYDFDFDIDFEAPDGSDAPDAPVPPPPDAPPPG